MSAHSVIHKESTVRCNDLLIQFSGVRARTESICDPLEIEDYSVQPIPDVSPPKWHLAHSTWFFEQFILTDYSPSYKIFSKDFAFLFNSYYNGAGERVLRPNRGLMTRPTVQEVMEYRRYVTKQMEALLVDQQDPTILDLVEIGINHEQQHQELLAYDIKYILGHQPTMPAFAHDFALRPEEKNKSTVKISEGVYEVGHKNDSFCFDNELGFHKVYLPNVEIQGALVTNGEFIEFIEDGGYTNFDLWHADGWDQINAHQIAAPLYWHRVHGEWHYYQFDGLVKVNKDHPVSHVSYYEAFAYSEWKGMRLPTEFEWEIASDRFDWGQLWEWTASAYLPYPGFAKVPGALGEYNGKFMVNQHVLRGASVATADGHSRHTYRNFFHPSSRWMFAGFRLAK